MESGLGTIPSNPIPVPNDTSDIVVRVTRGCVPTSINVASYTVCADVRFASVELSPRRVVSSRVTTVTVWVCKT